MVYSFSLLYINFLSYSAVMFAEDIAVVINNRNYIVSRFHYFFISDRPICSLRYFQRFIDEPREIIFLYTLGNTEFVRGRIFVIIIMVISDTNFIRLCFPVVFI